MLRTLLRRSGKAPSDRLHARNDFTLVFVHIPKTGGISLRQTLLELAPPPTFRILHPINDEATFAALPAAQRRAMTLVEGHMYYGVHAHVPRPCVYVTLLRDPVARVASFYRYVANADWHFLYPAIKRNRLTLEGCLTQKLTVELDNFMTRALTSLDYIHVPFGQVTRDMFLTAKAHLESITLIGITEDMPLLYRLMARTLGRPVADPPHLNRTDQQADGQVPRDLIMAHNQYDMELYDYARSLTRSRAAAAGLTTDTSGAREEVPSSSSPAVRSAG